MTPSRYFKLFLSLLTLTGVTANTTYVNADTNAPVSAPVGFSTEEAQKFIEETGNEIISVLADKSQPISQRKKSFRSVLVKDFNTAAIGSFVLGRHWRTLTNDQKSEYLKLFEDSIVESYASQFDKYSGQKLKIISAAPTAKNGVLVKTAVIQPRGGEPIKVDWQVFKKPARDTTSNNTDPVMSKSDAAVKIYDIIINGVSMSITQRSQYAAILAKGTGIEGLLKYMRSNRQIVDPVGVNNKAGNTQ